MGGFIGDANNVTALLSNVKNTVSGSVYGDGVLGGAVGRGYSGAHTTGLVTVFQQQSNATAPLLENAFISLRNESCSGCYANTTVAQLLTYVRVNATNNTYNLSNDSWTYNSTIVPQLNVTN